MKNKKERKLLKQIEAALNDTSTHLGKVRIFVWGSRILGWVGMIVAVFLVKTSAISPVVAILIAAFSGIGIGLAIYGQMALSQWPILKPYIDEQGIKNRLREIET